MKQPTTWENMLFFLSHGAITTAEVFISKFCKRAFGLDPIASAPKWIAIPVTSFLFLITTPLFLNPWVREDLLTGLRIPLVHEFGDFVKNEIPLLR